MSVPFVQMIPQYVDIATWADLMAQHLKLDQDYKNRRTVKEIYKLRDFPETMYKGHSGIWISDTTDYEEMPATNRIYYKLGHIPLRDHLNALTNRRSLFWKEAELVQIDWLNFRLGLWRWQYDTLKNNLLICLEGPAEGVWTETLI